MANDPGVGYKIHAVVTSMQGQCSAGHAVGDDFNLSCHNPDGMCGYCYHHIFPALSTFQFGGSYPWWQGDTIYQVCPDPRVNLTLKIDRTVRD